MQMPTMETRVASLEAVQTQINERLGNVETELCDMRKDVQSNMRWIIGIQITTLITLGALILVKLG